MDPMGFSRVHFQVPHGCQPKNRGKTPQIMNFNRVFPLHHFGVPLFLETPTFTDLLIGCLDKVPKIFSQMVGFHGDESHGRIRKKSPSTNESLRLRNLVGYWMLLATWSLAIKK